MNEIVNLEQVKRDFKSGKLDEIYINAKEVIKDLEELNYKLLRLNTLYGLNFEIKIKKKNS